MIQGYGALAPDETVIKKKQLSLLERKARDHDIYMAAMNRMRQEVIEYSNQRGDFAAGARHALTRFATLIVEEGRNV